ncbi:hypothetical protein Vretimale_5593 [Volvox reticuliferus]|nr:hypothetical protein Vretifemale_5617 [Volvox reticuliferus]GIM00617.1 hypothetical protein Vretimale_5593 [Volvox reticuliferus]
MEEENIRRTTTPAYRAPEMWDLYARQRIDTAVDIWALGVLLYVLAFGKLPFQGDSKLSILYGKYDMPPGRPAAMRSLIQDLLQVNPKDRPDIFQVISKLDILRNALSSDPVDSLPSQSLPLPAPAAPQPQQLQQFVPGPHGGASTQPNPPSPQGPCPGQPGAQQHRTLSQTANGQPGSLTNGPPVSYNTSHVQTHMQPQLQPHTQTRAHPHPQGPPPQLPQHQPQPSPHTSSQHGQQQYQPQFQHGQSQPYVPSSGEPHPGPGPGSGSATAAVVASPAQPRHTAGTPHAQLVPSRQGSFNPQWPAPTVPAAPAAPARQPQSGQQPAVAAAAGPVVPPTQLVNLMDAAMVEPLPSAAAALGPDWELGFRSGSGAGRGSGSAVALPSTAQDTVATATAAAAVVNSPMSAAYTRSVQLRRTGSDSEAGRLRTGSPMPTAGAAVHAAMGFGDDNVDWGEQPAFSWPAGQQHPQQSNSQLFRMDSMGGSMGPSGGGGAGGDGSGSTSAASPAMPPAPQPAGFLHSTSNSTSSQRSPLSMATVAVLPSGVVRGVSAAAAAAAVAAAAAQQQHTGSVSSGGLAGQSVATPEAAGTVMARSASSLVQSACSFELVAGDSAEVESLRAQLHHVMSTNSKLEGRMRQLEGTVASQDAMLQRLASELRTLSLHQQQQQQQHPQQPQHQASLSLPSPQQQQQPAQFQQQQHGAAASQQPVVATSYSSNGGDNGGGASTGLPRLVTPGSAILNPARGDAPGGTESSGGGRNAGSGDSILGDRGGDNGGGGGGGGAIILPGSSARAAATHSFESEAWSILGEHTTDTAIYPPLRYEDLA